MVWEPINRTILRFFILPFIDYIQAQKSLFSSNFLKTGQTGLQRPFFSFWQFSILSICRGLVQVHTNENSTISIHGWSYASNIPKKLASNNPLIFDDNSSFEKYTRKPITGNYSFFSMESGKICRPTVY